jgi:hypothetical protein
VATEEDIGVSAEEAELATRQALIADGLCAVAEWEQENGAFSADELESARRRVAARIDRPHTGL